MRANAVGSTIAFVQITTTDAERAAEARGFFPVLLYSTIGLALSVLLLFSGILTVPLESW
ncbi:hypothetical protein GCM10007036_21720 [Alsobacter metallidurans]|uniref:Uncharacterized protein n=1 Tax=Alsobacter metallidurans TaxID=340221 RepID=A0A917I7K3_9HYPH|nr:hypothetical protein GCM10007036_21720 [Alsobacter metallidurans]